MERAETLPDQRYAVKDYFPRFSKIILGETQPLEKLKRKSISSKSFGAPASPWCRIIAGRQDGATGGMMPQKETIMPNAVKSFVKRAAAAAILATVLSNVSFAGPVSGSSECTIDEGYGRSSPCHRGGA